MLQYEELALRHGTVFNSIAWIRIYDTGLKLYGIYNDNTELVGAFFLYTSSKWGMKYAITPPFTPHIGLFFENRAQNKSNQITYSKNIYDALSQFIAAQNYALLVAALPFKHTDTQVFFWNKFKVIPNYTYRLNLLVTKEELLGNFTSEKRKSLKKAEKDGLRVEKTVDLEIVKTLILKTFSRKEKALNIKLLDKILFEFSNQENSFAFVAYENNVAIATTFCIYDSTTAYYLFGGYDAEKKHHGAGVSTQWACICHAQLIGLEVYDFEGSMLPEVEKYFRDFGGDLIPYYTVNKAWLPIEMALKLKKRQVF